MWRVNLIFCLKVNIEVFWKLIPSFFGGRHAESTQNNKFAISLQHLKKKGGMNLRFCIEINIPTSWYYQICWACPFMLKLSKIIMLLNVYLKINKLCWLSCVMGIISFICQSKTITNYYFWKCQKDEKKILKKCKITAFNNLFIFRHCFHWNIPEASALPLMVNERTLYKINGKYRHPFSVNNIRHMLEKWNICQTISKDRITLVTSNFSNCRFQHFFHDSQFFQCLWDRVQSKLMSETI